MIGRVMALDAGEKWIGIALSDPLGILASPLMRISAASGDDPVAAIRRLVDQHEVKLVVVGVPYSMDGTAGRQAALVQDFVAKLARSLSVGVETWDERLSTVAAGRRMTEASAGRARKKEQIDAAAAAYILEGYLERRRREENEPESSACD
jgi:putative holliday junction resolvase